MKLFADKEIRRNSPLKTLFLFFFNSACLNLAMVCHRIKYADMHFTELSLRNEKHVVSYIVVKFMN